MNYDDVRFIMDSCGGGKKMDGCKGKSSDACNQKDECGGKGKGNCGGKEKGVALDAAMASEKFGRQAVALGAVNAVNSWLEGEPAEGLGLAADLNDRLVSVAGGDPYEPNLTDDENEIYNMAANEALDYMVSHGVSEEDAYAVIQDEDEDAASRVRDYLIDELPDGEDNEDDITNFVFSEEDQEPAMDGVGDKTRAFYKNHPVGSSYRKFNEREGKFIVKKVGERIKVQPADRARRSREMTALNKSPEMRALHKKGRIKRSKLLKKGK